MELDQAEVTRRALVANHAQNMTRGAKIPLPNGQKESATPYLGLRHPGEDATKMLSMPESMLKHPKPGYKYVWRRRTEPTTIARVRSEMYRPVEFDEVDIKNPLAAIVSLETPSGDYVLWEDLALFELKPEVAHHYYTAWEDYSKSILTQQVVEFKEEIAAESGGAYNLNAQVKDVGPR
jgi:hypothetical protein